MKSKIFLLFAVFTTFVSASLRENCPADDKIVVCYYASWAVYRPGVGAMNVVNIDPSLCTHLVYTFAGLNVIDNKIESLDPWNDFPANGGKDSYRQFVALKEKNPCLKTLLAIGGWNEKSRKYSVMASTEKSRKEFAESVLRYLVQYEFDGIDFDWEYPTQRGGIDVDKENLVLLLQELQTQLKPWKFMLTLAVAVTESVVTQAYDIPRIAQLVDYISLMAYDYTSPLSETTGHLAPLKSQISAEDTVAKSIDLWIASGCPPNKLVLGIPFYARSFKLADENKNGVGAPTVPNDMAGKFTQEIGFLSTYELYQQIQDFNFKEKLDENYATYSASNGTYWLTYDRPNTIKSKVQYALEKNLKGIMAWSIDTDDFRGIYSKEKFPLLRAINEALERKF